MSSRVGRVRSLAPADPRRVRAQADVREPTPVGGDRVLARDADPDSAHVGVRRLDRSGRDQAAVAHRPLVHLAVPHGRRRGAVRHRLHERPGHRRHRRRGRCGCGRRGLRRRHGRDHGRSRAEGVVLPPPRHDPRADVVQDGRGDREKDQSQEEPQEDLGEQLVVAVPPDHLPGRVRHGRRVVVPAAPSARRPSGGGVLLLGRDALSLRLEGLERRPGGGVGRGAAVLGVHHHRRQVRVVAERGRAEVRRRDAGAAAHRERVHDLRDVLALRLGHGGVVVQVVGALPLAEELVEERVVFVVQRRHRGRLGGGVERVAVLGVADAVATQDSDLARRETGRRTPTGGLGRRVVRRPGGRPREEGAGLPGRHRLRVSGLPHQQVDHRGGSEERGGLRPLRLRTGLGLHGHHLGGGGRGAGRRAAGRGALGLVAGIDGLGHDVTPSLMGVPHPMRVGSP